MTRKSSLSMLQRASERASAGAAALALTFLMLMTVDVRAGEARFDAAGDRPTVTVKFSELALDSSAGAAGVYRQLKVAARKVCGIDNGSRSLELKVAARECYEQALADAVRKIDRPVLTSLHTAGRVDLG